MATATAYSVRISGGSSCSLPSCICQCNLTRTSFHHLLVRPEDWNIMTNASVASVARNVPMTMGKLVRCKLRRDVKSKYGERLVDNIKTYIKKEKLLEYMEARKRSKAAAQAVKSATRELSYARAKESEAESRLKKAEEVQAKRVDEGVLPENYTEALHVRIKELVRFWAEEEQMNGNHVFCKLILALFLVNNETNLTASLFIVDLKDWNIMTNTAVARVSRQVPTTIEELSDCGLEQNVIRDYGERLVKSIKRYVEKEDLQQYL